MFAAPSDAEDTPDDLPRMPRWIASARAETPGDAAFLSGGALACLHLTAARPELPLGLLRARMALRAAEACVGFAGRPERAPALRDELALLRPGDRPGPGGEIYRQWMRATGHRVSAASLRRALPEMDPAHIPLWLDAGGRGAGGSPVVRYAAVLEAVLADHPASEAPALILAEAVLARAMGWDRPLPLLATTLSRRDLTLRGEALCLACHRAAVSASAEAMRLGGELFRSVARLRQVAPKLRAKGAPRAVEMFLSRDAVAPAALSTLMSDRAARRLCDRLVQLGAVRELTGRDTFRLYGV